MPRPNGQQGGEIASLQVAALKMNVSLNFVWLVLKKKKKKKLIFAGDVPYRIVAAGYGLPAKELLSKSQLQLRPLFCRGFRLALNTILERLVLLSFSSRVQERHIETSSHDHVF